MAATGGGDNNMVFQALKVLTEGTPAWSVVKPHGRSKNGREAYLGLIGSYMGAAVQLLLLQKATSLRRVVSPVYFTPAILYSFTIQNRVTGVNENENTSRPPIFTEKFRDNTITRAPQRQREGNVA